jgi:uncharacterized protein (DUF362 family)/Pyruvate/2-oxoacid:ferredoxin oxidoreductase delta subunit
MPSRVVILPAGYGTIDDTVRRVFERFSVTIRGRRVLIKPNVLRASAAADGIVTHPALVAAVVARVESLGASEIVVGDNPGVVSYGANEESFRRTGLMDAAGGRYRNIGTDSVTVPFNPDFMPSVSISRAVLESDVVISLPKFKTHGLTVLSGAIKNSYGILPGAQKARLHRAAGSQERFHELLVDVFRLRVPDLFIVDAVVGMEGNGPASPDLREVGLVLAADNGVALDAVIATLMGCEPARLRFLRRAQELGLGEYDLGRIEIEGELKPIPNFKLPPFSGEAILNNAAMQAAMDQRIRVRPKADESRCTGCGTCVDQCPASALSMEDALPRVDPEACIGCFCCQELCPERAMALS